MPRHAQVGGSVTMVLALTAWLSAVGQVRAQPFAYIGTRGIWIPTNSCFLGYCPRTLLHVVNTTTGHEVASVRLTDAGDVTGIAAGPLGVRVYISFIAYGFGYPPEVKGYVSILDTRSNTITSTLDAGVAPTILSVVPGGGAVLVTNRTSNGDAGVLVPLLRVMFSDTGSHLLLPTGTDPTAAVVTPDGLTVFVANAGSNDVTVIDTAAWTTLGTVPVGNRPSALAASPDGSRVYVANRDADTLSVIDRASRTVVATVPVGPQPSSVAVTSDGARIVVSTLARSAGDVDRVVVIDANQLTVAGTVPVTAATVSTGDDPALAYVAEPGSAPPVGEPWWNARGVVDTIDLRTFQILRQFTTPQGPTAFGSAGGCAYEVGPQVQAFRLPGGTGRIDVPAPPGCAWDTANAPDWLVWTSATSGSGPGSMTFTVAPVNEPRHAWFRVAGQELQVVQGRPRLVVERPQQGPVVAGPLTVVGWALNEDSEYWYCYGSPDCSPGVTSVRARARPDAGGAAIDLGSIEYGLPRGDVAAMYGDSFQNRFLNSGFAGVTAALSAGSYMLAVTAESQFGPALDETVEVPITVMKACASPIVSPVDLPIGATGGELAVQVTTADTDCAWGAESHADWISIRSPATVVASGSVTIVVQPQTWSRESRTGTVTIAGTLVTVTQTGMPCTYLLSEPRTGPQRPALAFRAGPAGGYGRVEVYASPTDCTWTAVSDAPWLTVVNPGTNTGNGWATIFVGPLGRAATGSADTAPRSATLTIGDATVSVAQSSAETFTLSPRDLTFVVGPDGYTAGQIVTVHAPRDVHWWVSLDGAETVLEASPVWGVGSGTFEIRLASGATLGQDLTRYVAVNDQWVTRHLVHVVRDEVSDSQPPFGLVDTPQQGAANLVGAIGLTGWALDDVGIERVRLYRNCLAFEPAVNCQLVDGLLVVFMGDATIVSGSRPDIEALYPTYPENRQTGWGYSILTNLLPHVPNQAMFGGQGPLTLYARARDVEGHEAWLGRAFLPGSTTASDGESTRITMANDAIDKPFGTIDTPAPGETVSGVPWNWGWALTPDLNTAAGNADDILVPTDGSTVTVWIDGAPRGPLTYDLCRGSAPGAVAAGAFCDDDIASIFGNPTPQPTYTPRADNPTLFRNLDMGHGAIAGYQLDTTTLTNGVHTLAWSVFDNRVPPRGDGLGSRYFTVLNAVADGRAGTGDPGPGAGSVTLSRRDTTDPRSPIPGPRSPADVRGRTGFSLDAPFVELRPDADGVRHVQVDEMGRLELQSAGFVESGYLVVNGDLRPLPVGSQFDRETGTFTWAPGVGFIGTYRLAFGRALSACLAEACLGEGGPNAPYDAADVEWGRGTSTTGPGSRVPDPDGLPVLVDVTIRPVTTPAPGDAALRMSLDTPQPGATINGSFLVAGWALDPHAAIGSGIGAVHVWAQRTDVPGEAPVFLGSATLAGARPDVADIYGPQFDRAGFHLRVPAGSSFDSLRSLRTGKDPASSDPDPASMLLPPGTYDITAYVWNIRTARWEDAQTVAIVVR